MPGPAPPGSTPSPVRAAWRDGARPRPDAGARHAATPSPARTGRRPARPKVRLQDGCYTWCVSRISPFVGLLFDRSRVGSLDDVTAPPYDVVSHAELLRYLHASPYNVIRLDLGEERPGEDRAEDKYRRAASELRSWREQRVLVPTDGPTYFAYEMRFSLHGTSRRIRGLGCAVELEDWGGSVVAPGSTRKGPGHGRPGGP